MACAQLRLPRSPTTRTQKSTSVRPEVHKCVWFCLTAKSLNNKNIRDRHTRVHRMPDYGCQILEARTER